MEDSPLSWAKIKMLEASPATDVSSVSVIMACTCAGGSVSGHTAETWPSLPQVLQRALVGFLGVVERDPLLDRESSGKVEPELPGVSFTS